MLFIPILLAGCRDARFSLRVESNAVAIFGVDSPIAWATCCGCYSRRSGTPMIVSAGIALYRRRPDGIEVLLVHPGGPYWAARDDGAWSVPKGLVDPGEDAFACARREFREETGFSIEDDGFDLGVFRQPSGKRLHIWAVEGDWDPRKLKSNLFELEWPPRSGRMQRFPEVDRAAWFAQEEAPAKILKGQRAVLEALYAFVAQPQP